MDRPTSVILIALYCFLFSVFFMYLAFCGIEKSNFVFSFANFKSWLTVAGPLVLMLATLILGVGILRLSNKCWKALFFLLLFLIGSMTALIMAAVLLLVLSGMSGYSFLEIFNGSSVWWLPVLCSFLSQIIVLYYLAREDIRCHFGE